MVTCCDISPILAVLVVLVVKNLPFRGFSESFAIASVNYSHCRER